jgi:hypothetical protein
MKLSTSLRILGVVALVTFAAVQVSADTSRSGGSAPGVLPPDMGRGPMEFLDDFEAYAPGSNMHGQGGWKGWDNNGGAGALVTNALSHSPMNSVDIIGASDLVHEFTGFNAGQWTLTAWMFIPGNSTANTYFIALNTYADLGPYNWSTQVCFNTAAGVVVDDIGADCTTGATLPIVTDQWVEIRVEIDLTANTQQFFYNGSMLYSDSWTEHVSGAGAVNIAAIDLFANASDSVFYDDVSLCNPAGCFVPVDLMSVSIDE